MASFDASVDHRVDDDHRCKLFANGGIGVMIVGGDHRTELERWIFIMLLCWIM